MRRVGKHIYAAHLRRGAENLNDPRAGDAQVVHVVVRVREGHGSRTAARGGSKEDWPIFALETPFYRAATAQQRLRYDTRAMFEHGHVGSDNEFAKLFRLVRGGEQIGFAGKW